MRYSLSDFNEFIEVSKKFENLNLNNEIMQKLESLLEEVGAPEYIKSPQFKSKIFYSGNLKNKIKNKNNFTNDDSWESFRTFQTTEFNKREGLDLNIDEIRKSLNMLTSKNYINIFNNIKKEFNYVFDNKTLNDFNILSNIFYEITSSNLLYNQLCAKIFKNICDEYPVIKNIVNKRISGCKDLIENIKYVDPDENYQEFCECNKTNEKTRIEFNFFAGLYNENLINGNDFNKLVIEIFNSLENFIELGNKKNEIDELSEIIYLIVSNSYYEFNKNCKSDMEIILEKIKKITNLKVKTTPGITNKCIFKHMDLLDEIKIHS
tara:strand:+ start:3794 stop:4756 length:963 start_codon:yes stop_codon:yes gene_type:complete